MTQTVTHMENKQVQALIASQKRSDGQIIEGVYISMAYRESGKLITLYVGTKESGPMLQYEPDGKCRYTGEELTEAEELELEKKFSAGVWTPIYSRGDYKRNYACGGHWSGHTKNLHPSIGTTWSGKQEHLGDQKAELLVLDGGPVVNLPPGIKGDVTIRSIDCSPSWVIWYKTAEEAMRNRLKVNEISEARLPEESKQHLIQHEDESAEIVNDLIAIYDL